MSLQASQKKKYLLKTNKQGVPDFNLTFNIFMRYLKQNENLETNRFK